MIDVWYMVWVYDWKFDEGTPNEKLLGWGIYKIWRRFKKRKVFQKVLFTAQKMKFHIKDFFSKCDLIRRKLRIWSHFLKKSLMKNFIFCAIVSFTKNSTPPISRSRTENIWGTASLLIVLQCSLKCIIETVAYNQLDWTLSCFLFKWLPPCVYTLLFQEKSVSGTLIGTKTPLWVSLVQKQLFADILQNKCT